MPPMEKLQLPHPSAAASPEAMMDDDPLLAVAVPKAGDEGDEEISYKTLVFSMLELAKQYPADARARGAAGAARIYFEIDDTGAVKTVKLRESSGDTELDVESLALVERAAPFPKPPRGAQKSFNAVIEYGSNEH
jgi:colicin import membrane protein